MGCQQWDTRRLRPGCGTTIHPTTSLRATTTRRTTVVAVVEGNWGTLLEEGAATTRSGSRPDWTRATFLRRWEAGRLHRFVVHWLEGLLDRDPDLPEKPQHWCSEEERVLVGVTPVAERFLVATATARVGVVVATVPDCPRSST